MRFFLLSLAFFSGLLNSPATGQSQPNLFSPDVSRYDLGQQVIYRIYTESDPPRSFKNSSGKLTGSSVDIVQELLNRLGRVEAIEMRSWDEAYGFLTKGPNTIVFSVARTKERAGMFKWVGPLGQSKLQLFARAGSPEASVKSASDWKQAKVITVQGWYSESYLRENGYQNIITLSSPILAMQKLMDGTGDYLCLPELSAAGAILFNHLDTDKLVRVANLETIPLFIAFSSDVSDQTIENWQKTLNQMNQDGFISRNQQKWVNIYLRATGAKK